MVLYYLVFPLRLLTWCHPESTLRTRLCCAIRNDTFDRHSPTMHSSPMQVDSPGPLIPTISNADGEARNAKDKRTRLTMLNTTVHEPNHCDTHAKITPDSLQGPLKERERTNESFPETPCGISMNSTYASHQVMTIASSCARSRSSGPGSRASPISRSSFWYL